METKREQVLQKDRDTYELGMLRAGWRCIYRSGIHIEGEAYPSQLDYLWQRSSCTS